jgi:dephospho-CoA kinase
MLEVGLTGSRKSGKDGVAKLFTQLGVPVFDADAILKYLLNYRPGVVKSVEKAFGKSYIIGDYINPLSFDTDEKFNALLNLVEFELFESFHRFKQKQKNRAYVMFHSSIIFERNYQNKFDSVVNVFTPKSDRMERYIMQTGDTLTFVQNLFSHEISDLSKNQSSNFIIHNYYDAPDILDQVQNIDDKIFEKYLTQKIDLDDYSKNILAF